MFITKTKKTKAIDMDSKLKEYVIKNYDNESLTEKLKSYFGDLTQNRNVISQMGEVQDAVDQIKQNVYIITSYINQILLIKQKMSFGKEDYSCKIEFTWNDTIKGSSWHSFNIWFEIYNAIFNLAVSYYCLGTGLAKEATEKNGYKEACNCFKQAMYLFNLIKEEAITKITEKELPYDLYPSHMDYCMTLCEIEGQMQIYKISKETNPKDFELHAKLMLEISQLYLKAKNLSENPMTRKGTSDLIIEFLENRSHYYNAMMCRDLKDGKKTKHEEKGEGYGEMLFFQGCYVQALLNCQKNIKKCAKLVDVGKFEAELGQAQKDGQEIQGKNERIYHQKVPNPEEVNMERKNMMKMTLPQDLYIRENSEKAKSDDKIFCPDLELLVPKEVKNMINNYKEKMNSFIMSNLDQYQNEGTINNFVDNLFLPKNITRKKDVSQESLPPSEFPPQLWEKSERIQQIGGTMCLQRVMNGIMNKSQYLIGQCENLLRSLEAEDKDDQSCRQRFGSKWIREPSQKLNFKLVQGAQQYIQNLQKTKQFDQQENDDIMNNAKFFEQLLLPREKLVNNIPRKEEIVSKELPEEKEVRTEILKLYELGDKCMGVINPIFADLNDDSTVVSQFLEVLAKKTTEQAIFEKYKEIYEGKFADLKILSDEVKKQEDVVMNVVQKNSAKIRDKPKQNVHNEAMNYFRMLDQYANMFLNKHDKIMKGDKYYNNLYEKITALVKTGNDWMIKRSNEKKALFCTLEGPSAYKKGGNYDGTRLTDSALMNPEKNPTTNMNVHRNYGYQGNMNNQRNNNQGYGNQGNFNNNNRQGGFGGPGNQNQGFGY